MASELAIKAATEMSGFLTSLMQEDLDLVEAINTVIEHRAEAIDNVYGPVLEDLNAQLKQSQDNEQMSSECFNMIRKTLNTIGCSHSPEHCDATPPR